MFKKVIFLLLLNCSLTFANELKIFPVHILLTPQQKIAVLSIQNDSSEKELIQITAKKWNQKNNADWYPTTNELLVMPPMFVLKPHQKQIIRIAYKPNQENIHQESAYRLFIDEVSSKLLPQALANQLRVHLRVLIPVFFLPISNLKTAYEWEEKSLSKNHPKLTIKNSGNKVILVTQWQLYNHNKPISKSNKTLLYVLPHHIRYVPIQAQLPKNTIIKSIINGQKKENTIRIIG